MLSELEQSKLSTSNIEPPKEKNTIGPIQILEEKRFSQFLPGKIEALEEIAKLPKEELSVGPIQILAEKGFLEYLPEKMEDLKEEPAAPTQIWGENALPTFTTVQIKPSKEENVDEISNDPIRFLGKDDTLELAPVEMKSLKNENVVEISIADILNSSFEDENEDPNPNQLNAMKNVQTEKRLIPTLSRGVINKGCQKHKVASGTIWCDIFKTVQTADDQNELKKVEVTEPPSKASSIEPHKFTTLNAYKPRCNLAFKEENVEEISIGPIQFLGKDDTSELATVKIKSPKNENVVEISMADILNSSFEDENEDPKPNQPNVVINVQTGKRPIPIIPQSIINNGCKKRKIARGTIWYDVFQTVQTVVEQDKMKVVVTEAPATASIIKPHEFTTLHANEHRCNHCKMLFKEARKVRSHIRNRHREAVKQCQCPYCPFKSKYLSSVRQHITLKHKDENNIQWFKCDSCDKKFKIKALLKAHLVTHISSEQLAGRMEPCSMCEKTFTAAHTLRRHVKRTHSNKEPLQCKECPFSAMDPRRMRKHVEVFHTSAEQRRAHECDQCDYRTTYKHEFEKHYNTHKASYRCQNCSFVACSTLSLKQHQFTHKAKIDEHELKYRCNECDYKTYREYSLTVHKLNHLKPDEIEYSYCYHCDFKAKRKNNLKAHLLRHFQKEEVSFQCFGCDFQTKKRTLLTEHLKNHSKSKV